MDIFIKKLFYPDFETSFLNHFKGFYDSVFIAFSPFFKLANNEIENPSVQKSHQITYEQLKSEVKEFAKIPEFKAKIFSQKNENYPDDKAIAESGKIITWQEIKEKALFKDFGEINKALKTSIGGYREVFEKSKLLEKLNFVTEKEQIFHPNEGNFAPLVKIQIYKTLKYLNKTEILVIDEYLETEKELDLNTISLDEFVEKVKVKDYYIYPKDKSILFSIDWDSFFFIICSNQPSINEVIKAGNFEGFSCLDTTEHSWEFTKEETLSLLELEKQMKEKKTTSDVLRGRDIVCFSHDWTGDPLSKTHLMRVLSRENRILWINSLANRMPTASTKDLSRIVKKLKSFTEPVREVEKNIFVLNPLAIPAYGTEAVRKFNEQFLLRQVKKAMRKLDFVNPLNIIFNPAAGLLAGKIGETELVYYCVDEYTAFTGAAKGLREIEENLFKKVDLVIVSAEKLYESKKDFNPNTFIIRHGVDFAHFRTALDEKTEIPDEIKDLPKPIIGFHGLLADWVDFELIKKTAEHFADGSIVLIGKITVDAERKIKILDNVKNIHFLGRKPYAELPAFCKGFDVALNPFEISELTLAANPLKVREYLAAGLEVVSTDIPEVRILDFCRIGETHEDFIRQIEASLANPLPKTIVSDSIKAESWEARIDELRGIMAKNKK
ncbi:MAG: DUF2711 family protein [Pyrinomonadaceae bacterium]|nr:DUF2711 family protein [Pyrinomonadaceae bacterium]